MRDESRRIVGFVVPRSLRVSCSLTAEAGKISRSASAPQRSAPAAFFSHAFLPQEAHRDTTHRIVQRVRDHSWPQTLPPLRQNSEHQAVDRNHNGWLHALINVASAK